MSRWTMTEFYEEDEPAERVLERFEAGRHGVTSHPRPTWDDTWLMMARIIGHRSRCDRRRVGAIIVGVRNEIEASSYNGPPAGWRDEFFLIEDSLQGCLLWCERAQHAADALILPGTYHTCPSLHAEANALLRADRTKIEGGTIYVSSAVCHDCAKLVANSGLARVVMDVLPGDAHRDPAGVEAYLRTCGLLVTTHHRRDMT